MCRDQGIYLSRDALTVAYRELDVNGDRRISYEEFLAWKRKSAFCSLSLDDDKIQQRLNTARTFDKYDTDGDGVIDRAEFIDFYDDLKDMGVVSCDVRELLVAMDKNQNNVIEFNEVVGFLEGIKF